MSLKQPTSTNTVIRLIVLAITLPVFLGACKMTEALDATTQMNAKMNEMVTQTGKMKDLLEESVGGVNQSVNGIKTTNSAIRLQKLSVALADMEHPNHTKHLDAPLDMIPGGLTFAEEATAEEIIRKTYAWLKVVRFGQANGDKIDALTKEDKVETEKHLYGTEVKHSKEVAIMSAMIVAAFTPQNVVNQIIEEQIVQGGRFHNTALEFLYLRFSFIFEYLLSEKDDELFLNTIGQVEFAVNELTKLETILSLSFIKQIGFEIEDLSILNYKSSCSEEIFNCKTKEDKQCKRNPGGFIDKDKNDGTKVVISCEESEVIFSSLNNGTVLESAGEEKLLPYWKRIKAFLDNYKTESRPQKRKVLGLQKSIAGFLGNGDKE